MVVPLWFIGFSMNRPCKKRPEAAMNGPFRLGCGELAVYRMTIEARSDFDNGVRVSLACFTGANPIF
ncbi:MAG: hypothetical protein Rhirs2KO_15360 [Rhizobiaceae bacterium]